MRALWHTLVVGPTSEVGTPVGWVGDRDKCRPIRVALAELWRTCRIEQFENDGQIAPDERLYSRGTSRSVMLNMRRDVM